MPAIEIKLKSLSYFKRVNNKLKNNLKSLSDLSNVSTINLKIDLRLLKLNLKSLNVLAYVSTTHKNIEMLLLNTTLRFNQFVTSKNYSFYN